MCPNNMKVVRVQPYGLYVAEPQLSDDDRSTECVYARKTAVAMPPPVLDGKTWTDMCNDFALDGHNDYEEISEAKVKRSIKGSMVATTASAMDDDVWLAMNEDFACDWKEEEHVKPVAVKPKQIHEPCEYGDYTMWGA